MTLLDALLAVSSRFCEARGLSAARTSTLVFGDGKVLTRLSEGRDLTTRRLETAMQWFSTHWPDGAAWPTDVPRPSSAMSDVDAVETSVEGVSGSSGVESPGRRGRAVSQERAKPLRCISPHGSAGVATEGQSR